MFLAITYPSASTFWLNVENYLYSDRFLQSSRELTRLPLDHDVLTDPMILQGIVDKYDLETPLDIYVPSAKDRRNSTFVHCNVLPKHLPPKSFVEIDPLKQERCRVFMACPELCFLLAASKMSFYELTRFGYDLCAMYLPDHHAEYGQRRRQPVTNVESIQAYLDSDYYFAGHKKAKQALRYIYNNSNSPMESTMSMLASLPLSLGGFSLDGQELNGIISLSREGTAIFGRPTCCCDMVWRKEKVIVEYDSNATHLTPDQHDWDKRKISALINSGYRVLSVTSRMISTVEETEKTFMTLRKMLGKRKAEKRVAETTFQRSELLSFLKRC